MTYKKRWANFTLLKYFLSYFAVYLLLMLGTYFIVNGQLKKEYYDQLCSSAQDQLSSYAISLNQDVIYLSQVHEQVSKNLEIVMSRYNTGKTYSYAAYQQLLNHAHSSELVKGIVYMADCFDTPLYAGPPVSSLGSAKFRVYTSSEFYQDFDLTPYMDCPKSQLILLSDEAARYLIYFPPTPSSARSILFYFLDTFDIETSMAYLASNHMPSVALVSNDGQIAASVAEQRLLPYLNDFQGNSGILKLNSTDSLCIQANIVDGYSLLALISNESLLAAVTEAFWHSYLLLFLLGLAGMLVIFLSMRTTYLPLYKLTKKASPNFDHSKGHLQQLDAVLTSANVQIASLQAKMDMYRLHIQKSLLESAFGPQNITISGSIPDIDRLFDPAAHNELYVLCLESPGEAFPCSEIMQLFNETFHQDDFCILLDFQGNHADFLLNYSGIASEKTSQILVFLQNLYDVREMKSAISNPSESPLDIPTLVKNAKLAVSYWPKYPVADYTMTCASSASAVFAYPHEKLDCLNQYISTKNVAAARLLVSELFEDIDLAIAKNIAMPDFFCRSILVDILTSIVNALNQAGVKFLSFSNLYYETLHYCRNLPYMEHRDSIRSNTEKLLDIYEQEVVFKTISASQLRAYIEDSYCDPNFSISSLADAFHISVSSMSNLVKKELGENFSTYLWNLRLQKATDLILHTDLSIDEISISVGYVNTRSFRRKFKQETNTTPSALRNEKRPANAQAEKDDPLEEND